MSKSPAVSGKRNRVTPAALQSRIRSVHNSFDEENQFITLEAVNSPHNVRVISAIVEAIGTNVYQDEVIRRGCKTYKKTLTERHKHESTPMKEKKQLRSRKQRTYERRSKFVKKGREAKIWESVTADMMSEEEKRGETYVRHQPEYRSDKFTSFINKLDERYYKKKSVHARYKRSVGTPTKKSLPTGIHKWLVKPVQSAEQPGQSAEQLPGQSAEQLPGQSAEQLPGHSAEQLPGQSAGRSAEIGDESSNSDNYDSSESESY